MIWVRKGFVYLLSLLLFLTLLGTAYSTSANQTLGQPKKVEKYLAQSKLYDHFVAYMADQAKKSEGDNSQSGSVSLNDAAVLDAAKSAFPPQLIQNSVDTFLDANYAWLEGKTATPRFNIDLTAQKTTFAQKVGQVVKAYSATLPACTDAQAAQEVNVDPLAATCLPAGITPDQIGAQVTERLTDTGAFLSNPVVTAGSVNPNGNQSSQPYYKKLSRLPRAYQLGTKLPYVLGALSVLFAISLVFISLTRRQGWRRVGIVLALAGLVLIVSQFVSDQGFKKAENHVFNSSSVGQLQQSLTNFAQRIESAMAKTDLWFGIAFLVLALVIFGILLKTRQKSAKTGSDGKSRNDADGKSPEAGKFPALAKKRLRRPFGDSIMPLGTKPAGTEPEEPETPEPSEEASEPEETPPRPKPKRKPPRLIQ